ncbi:hypothetical protein HDU89_003215 [Geranomyces variabilis]|nr:hypothetical protein HDU89_003215 [Geranomyces variabilis]
MDNAAATAMSPAAAPCVSRASGWPFVWLMAALVLAEFLTSLDNTLVTTASPVIVKDLGSIGQLPWVASSYLLALTTGTLLLSRLSDLYGRRSVTLAAMAIFLAGSAGCGAAPSMTFLIGMRAVQGFGGGGLAVLGSIIVTDMVPMRERGTYIGLFSLAWIISSLLGPPLGGLFADHLSWRWGFYVNVPLTAIATVLAFFFLRLAAPRPPSLKAIARVDVLGTLVFTGAIACAIFATLAQEEGQATATIVGLYVSSVSLLLLGCAVEVWHEKTGKVDPIIPPSLFRHRNIWTGFTANVALGAVQIAPLYYLPLYFQYVLGDSPTSSGLHLFPLLLVCIVFAIASGVATSVTGVYRLYAAGGLVFAAIGFFLAVTFDENTSQLAVYGYTCIMGGGVGAAVPALQVLMQTVGSAKDNASILGAMNFARNIGSIAALAASGAIFVSGLNARRGEDPNLAPYITNPNAEANAALSANDLHTVRAAYVLALRPIYYLYAGCALVAAGFTVCAQHIPLSKEVEDQFADPLDERNGQGDTIEIKTSAKTDV